MGNRCDSCSKFVSLENADPEAQLSVEYSEGTFAITADISHTRQCAECGSDLKTYSDTAEQELKLEDIDAFKTLTPKAQKSLRKALDSKKVLPDIDFEDGEVEESGGSRYKANDITIRINYKLAIDAGAETKIPAIVHSGSVEAQTTAGSYEDY